MRIISWLIIAHIFYLRIISHHSKRLDKLTVLLHIFFGNFSESDLSTFDCSHFKAWEEEEWCTEKTRDGCKCGDQPSVILLVVIRMQVVRHSNEAHGVCGNCIDQISGQQKHGNWKLSNAWVNDCLKDKNGWCSPSLGEEVLEVDPRYWEEEALLLKVGHQAEWNVDQSLGDTEHGDGHFTSFFEIVNDQTGHKGWNETSTEGTNGCQVGIKLVLLWIHFKILTHEETCHSWLPESEETAN